MRILVTGLKGFTGQYIELALTALGHDVIGISSDLRELENLKKEVSYIKPDAVIHLAALAFVAHGCASDFYEVNLIGTRNLLASIEAGAPNIHSVLLASSANVYGNASEGEISESETPLPVNDYAVSKLAMEYMASLWQGKLPIFITRPFNYTGIGQASCFLIPKVVEHFIRRDPFIELGNLDVFREFNDVRFVADAYAKLIELAPVGKTINVCTGHVYSLREILASCEKLTGHTLEVRVNPDFVRENEVKSLSGDSALLNKLIPNLVPQALEETLSWMLLGE